MFLLREKEKGDTDLNMIRKFKFCTFRVRTYCLGNGFARSLIDFIVKIDQLLIFFVKGFTALSDICSEKLFTEMFL